MNLLNTFNVTLPSALRGIQFSGIQKGLEKNGIEASFLDGADDIKNLALSNPQNYINDLNKFSIEDVAKQTCEEIENRTRVLSSIKKLLPKESLYLLRDELRKPYTSFNLQAYNSSASNRKCVRTRYYNGVNNYKKLASSIADELDKDLNTQLGIVRGGKYRHSSHRKKSRSRSRSRKTRSRSKSKRKSKSKK